ncbi:MAG: hypothetical protein K0Q61_3518 [Rhodococcus erythropolis]|jgi:hypothetical protein|nr:hypothetical protein [Rhodococcus erythropolis]
MNSTTPSADEFFFVALICSPLQVYSAQRTAKCRNRHQIETSYSNRVSLVNFPLLEEFSIEPSLVLSAAGSRVGRIRIARSHDQDV